MSLCEICVSNGKCHISLDECEKFGLFIPKLTFSPKENVTCGDCLNRGVVFNGFDYCYACKAGSHFEQIPQDTHQLLEY